MQETQSFKDLSQSWNGKLTQVLSNGHQLVSGVELEGVRRSEDAVAEVADDAGNMRARTSAGRFIRKTSGQSTLIGAHMQACATKAS